MRKRTKDDGNDGVVSDDSTDESVDLFEHNPNPHKLCVRKLGHVLFSL